MGYPTDFKIPVSDTQAYRQFGNSVVVPVVERIAEQVVATLSLPANHKPDFVLTPPEPPRKRGMVAVALPLGYLKVHKKTRKAKA